MKTDRFASLVLLSVLLSSCVQNVRPQSVDDAALFSTHDVYFATTRNDTGKQNLNTRFGKKRTAIGFGVNDMAIPADYPKAHATSFIHWNISLKRDPQKYLALINTRRVESSDFYLQLRSRLEQTANQPVLLFIHGFNTPFERASRITAKLAYDLNLSTPAILFSWPSLERPSAYPADEDNLAWSQPYFDQFLTGLLSEFPDTPLILVGHSMGTRALTQGLINVLDQQPEFAEQIQGVVLAAPDIDADIFRRDIAPALVTHQLPMSLYASNRDLAMVASNQLHGYPRAGFAGDNIVVVPGIDTIDASLAETELLGHEYFYQGAHTISDIYQWLIEQKPPAERRFLQPVTEGGYWQLVP